ncbi:MAG: papain-like cysteine protease family protein [Candidatus Competibacterales bacterium]|nr:papain-like cysteine protease family protein [Candidatus Competibacterales bacterium]
MAKVLLNVPLVPQSKSLTCWHASALMLWYYWQGKTGYQGPMYTIPNKWENNQPVTPQEFITLANNVGLTALPLANQYSSDDLGKHLGNCGPLWSAGYWFGYGHIVVLTGVDGNTIHYNDPEHGGSRKTGTVSWFNTKLASQLPGCLMYKDPKGGY